jgi:hypothetical protein
MKSITLLLGVYILFSLDSCSQDFKKLNAPDVDSKKVLIAQKFANDYLTTLKKGSYYQFKDEAIDILKNQLTEQNQKAIYQQLKNQLGDFQSLEYAETWIQSSNPSLNIFRFKSDFEKSNKKIEIRVVLDKSDKIAGFWVKPWSDMLN